MLDFQIARELDDAKEAVQNAPNSATGKGQKRILQEIKDARKNGDPDVLITKQLFGTEWGKRDTNLKKLINAWDAVKTLDSWKVWEVQKIQKKKRAEKIAAEGAKFHMLNKNERKRSLPRQDSLTDILAMGDGELTGRKSQDTTLLTTKVLEDIPPSPSLPPLPPVPTEAPLEIKKKVWKTPPRDSLMLHKEHMKHKASTANRPQSQIKNPIQGRHQLDAVLRQEPSHLMR